MLWVCYALYWAIFVVVVISYNKKIDRLEKKIFEMSVDDSLNERNKNADKTWVLEEKEEKNDGMWKCWKGAYRASEYDSGKIKFFRVEYMEKIEGLDFSPIKRTFFICARDLEDAKSKGQNLCPDGLFLMAEQVHFTPFGSENSSEN